MKIASSFCLLFRQTWLTRCLTLLACCHLAAVYATEIPVKPVKSESDTVAFADGDATTEGIDETALQSLVKRAGETHSNALVIVKNGKLIGQWYFGHLVKIASLDVPLASFYPSWRWTKDLAGQPTVTGGLSLNAIDLAKVGNMLISILQNGDSAAGGGSKNTISKSWIDQSTGGAALPKISPDHGLLWWLLRTGSDDYNRTIGFMGRGFHGQFLIVLPQQRLVIVRQISEKSHKSEGDDFADLPDLTKKLCPALESVQ